MTGACSDICPSGSGRGNTAALAPSSAESGGKNDCGASTGFANPRRNTSRSATKICMISLRAFLEAN